MDQIQITEGVATNTAALQEIQAGTEDMFWDQNVPTVQLAGMVASKDPDLTIGPDGNNYIVQNPYMSINLQSPNNHGALKKLLVRQALEYAVNKVALAKIYGGADFNTVLNQVFGPGAQGYIAGYNPYPTPNNEGDPTTCKSLLTAAGYPNGFTITDAYRTDGSNAVVFQEIQSDFAACGVTVNGTGISQGYYTSSGILADSAGQLANSGWDIAFGLPVTHQLTHG